MGHSLEVLMLLMLLLLFVVVVVVVVVVVSKKNTISGLAFMLVICTFQYFVIYNYI